MLLPEMWINPVDVGPARVSAGEPSMPPFAVERPGATRDVNGILGGHKALGRSAATRLVSPSFVKGATSAAPVVPQGRHYPIDRLSGDFVACASLGQAGCWRSDWFYDHGLYKLMGTIRYSKAA